MADKTTSRNEYSYGNDFLLLVGLFCLWRDSSVAALHRNDKKSVILSEAKNLSILRLIFRRVAMSISMVMTLLLFVVSWIFNLLKNLSHFHGGGWVGVSAIYGI